MKNLIMTYRGNIQACTAHENHLLFVTTHPEKQATDLYQVTINGSLHETRSFRQYSYPLPCGANDLLLTGTIVWLAGQDGKLYTQDLDDQKNGPRALRGIDTPASPIRKLVKLAEGHLGLLQPARLELLHCNSGKLTQTIELDGQATVAATDSTGHWLAIGFQSGEIAVYQYQEGKLHFSAKATIHQGRVSAIAFEPHELRFFSAGADKKLCNTHAQGELQALDKGKSSNHDGVINTILISRERFFTGASDKSIKAWAYSGGRPLTINKSLPKVKCLARLEVEGKGILAACGTDNSLCFMQLNSQEEPNEVVTGIDDGYAWADTMLRDQDIKRNENALELLARYNDKKSFELLTRYLGILDKKPLREQIVSIAEQSSHPDSSTLLETTLQDAQHDTVRMAALNALVKHIRNQSIRPYTLALETGFVDTGSKALEALGKLAQKQPLAEQAIISALGHPQRKLCLLALYLLESVYGKTDPKASLQALRQNQPELQRAALIRLYQRGLLDNPEVQRALLNAQDNRDAWVRQTAFLIAILGQPALADTLKQREAGLARQLKELETFDLLEPEASKPKAGTHSPDKTSLLQKVKNTFSGIHKPKEISQADLKPLLQGMSSQYADICFNAAFALAVLQDQRAFGLLLLLSQEKDTSIRVGVCHAFALLQQTEALQQLTMLLDDAVDSVRDAAFTAITLLESDPWQQARYGFASRHEDIHNRALKTLLDTLGKNKTQKLPEDGLALLRAALNNPFENIRQETFKACLNRQLGGDMPGTLHLLCSSQYENVHNEVLGETLAALREDWALNLLPELLDDDFQAIRQAAFTHTLAEKKRFDRHAILERAIASRFADVRRSALNAIKTKPGEQDWQLIQGLLQDEEPELRLLALRNIVQADDTATLEQALDSRFEDIRIQAAIACARFASAKAYEPLSALARTEKPQQKHEQAQWHGNVLNALRGLELLEDSRAFDCVLEHACSKDELLAEEACHVLPWVCNTSHIGQLIPLLNHERDILRANAAFALAMLGDETGHQALGDENLGQLLIAPFRMAVVLTCQPFNIPKLRPWLEQAKTVNSASLILFSHELLLHADRPALSLSALSVDNPALQRRCADLLSRYHQPEQCWEYLQQDLSRQLKRDDQPDWQIPLKELKQLAAVLVHGSHHLRARLLFILQSFDHKDTLESWASAYRAFAQRYADAIANAEGKVKTGQPDTRQQSQWQNTAFGAYLGLLRAEDRFHSGATLNLRLQSIKGLRRLAEQGDNAQRQSVFSCLLTLLNHPGSALRDKAYDDLQALGLPLDELGKAAAASRHDEMAQRGLQLLADHYPIKQSRKLLQDMLATGSETLAQKAYELLHNDADTNLATLAPLALQSYSHTVRHRCITELAQHYADSADISNLLVAACDNESRDVAQQAVLALARHQHPLTLEKLQTLWHGSEDAHQQNTLLSGFRLWRGKGAAAVLLTCGDNQETLKLHPQAIYSHLGAMRDTAVASTLLQRLQDKHPDSLLIAGALLGISGYDQVIEEAVDTDQPSTSKRWQEKQFPRHDELFIKLFGTLLQTDLHKKAQELLGGMAWLSPNPTADQALAEAVAISSDNLLEAVINTIAIRARRRNGSIAALLKLLTHKNPHIQFLAAEGLGCSGHAQGNNILLASSQYLDDLNERRRAIDALGQSGDPAVLDKLLELANNKEHALCEAATEAIGHLGKSEQAERILKLLQQHLKQADTYSDMNERALSGLRWFNTLEAWQTVADFAEDKSRYNASRAHAVKLLSHWDSEHSRRLLLNILRKGDDWKLCEAAWDSARHLWQATDNEASPVDMAVMQGRFVPTSLGDQKTLERITRYASTEQLMELLSQTLPWAESWTAYGQESLSLLRQSLLQKQDHKPADIASGLAAERTETVALMAHLASVRTQPDKAVQTALQRALETRHVIWQQRWKEQERKADSQTRTACQTEQHTLENLFRAAVIQRAESPLLPACLQSREPSETVFHATILTTLLQLKSCHDKALLEAVRKMQHSPSLNIRQLAQQAIHQHDGKQTDAGWEHFLHQPKTLADKTFNPAIVQAARGEKQSRALPVLIQQQAVEALNTIAVDTAVDEIQRIGAIEGLGRIRTHAAEACLQALCKQQDIDEDLGRAAFRALRRSQRARHKASLDKPKQGAAA